MIRSATAHDANALCAIYNHYVDNTVITFEEARVTDAEFSARIAKVQGAGLPWLAAECDGALIGYAYAGPWRERSAYRFSVESTVYLAPEHTGKGWGTRLYAALFAELRKTQVHAVIGGIALPNEASIALHEKLGMRKVAHFPQVGFKFRRWIDVAYWQLELRTDMEIRVDNLEGAAIRALIGEHLASMYANSPPESVHALDLDKLRGPDVTFWSAWDRELLLGCGALKELDARHGEIKSMRTPDALRRRGAGRALLMHIIGVAKQRGYTRLSLETGSFDAFLPARKLYESAGFTYCGPFGDYREDPYSSFMTLQLES